MLILSLSFLLFLFSVGLQTFSQATETFVLGAGVTFSEAHQYAASQNRVISTGWSPSVGVVGWSIGGGHGPLAASLGWP